MEFSRQLYAISEALDRAELAALKFLSLEYVPLRKQEAIEEPKAFFQALLEKGMIEAGDLAFLRELLYRISRMDLLAAQLGSSREAMERELQIPGRAQVSPFRYLLFQLSENITKEEMKCFKFLLGKELPKCKLSPETTMLDVFIEMEKKGILGEDNLTVLKTLCEKIDKSLLKKIEEYELNLFGEEEMLVIEGQRSSTGVPETCPRLWASSVAHDSPGSCDQSSQLEAYKMTSRPRGVCLILNNHNFAKARKAVPELKKMKDRNGTDVDAAALSKVFSTLHFKIEEYKDLTAEEIRKIVNIYRCKDHNDKDCFVCCVLSHGKKGIIYGVDGQEACQGDARQKGVTIETDSGEQDSSLETDARFQLDCIPSEADFLLGMATLQDYVSYRSSSQGSWYIQSLCQHLENSCPRGEDILTILTAVNQEVSRKIDKQNAAKQMPQPSFTLRKKLIFPVN
ncbi:caspase-8 isoform X2 [Oxyura jamaicensis]|uniref:caspase-8 isoform X2 n=1 Tax=Oxyura jamaicensis TaxID=8884 RepID=UPI0015A6E23B|nr:caspase-8 isoform X2 [Oxyura jamaicensis]